MQDRHLQEQLNRRSMYLRLRPRLWVVPVSMAVGALLCFLIYTLVIVTVYGQRQYRETATYELSFAQNEETGTAYDYFNAATWQGLIFTHPQIADTVEQELPEGMSMEEAQEDTKADLISDIRYLTVEVTTPSVNDTAQLSLAIRDGLEHFGETAKEFDSIEFLSATEPELVVVSDRSRNAALLGMVLGLLISWAALYLHTLLDDAVYVPEDAQKRYGLPVLGVLPAEYTENEGRGEHREHGEHNTRGGRREHGEHNTRGGRREHGEHNTRGGHKEHGSQNLPLMLRRQLPLQFSHALAGKKRVLLMSLSGADDAKRVLSQLGRSLADTGARESGRYNDMANDMAGDGTGGRTGGEAGDKAVSKADRSHVAGTTQNGLHCGFIPTGPADDPACDAVNRTCRDVIVVVHYGGERGPRMENFLATLAMQGYQIAGLLLVDANARFLQEYYR